MIRHPYLLHVYNGPMDSHQNWSNNTDHRLNLTCIYRESVHYQFSSLRPQRSTLVSVALAARTDTFLGSAITSTAGSPKSSSGSADQRSFN